jgi:VanZ family protein
MLRRENYLVRVLLAVIIMLTMAVSFLTDIAKAKDQSELLDEGLATNRAEQDDINVPILRNHGTADYYGYNEDQSTPGEFLTGDELSVYAIYNCFDEKPQTMIVAIYEKNNVLVNYKMCDGEIFNDSGTTEIDFRIKLRIPTGTSRYAYYQIFFWDSQTYVPIRKAKLYDFAYQTVNWIDWE